MCLASTLLLQAACGAGNQHVERISLTTFIDIGEANVVTDLKSFAWALTAILKVHGMLRVMKSLSRLMFVNLAVFYHTSLYIFCTGYGKRRVSFTACQSAHRHHI